MVLVSVRLKLLFLSQIISQLEKDVFEVNCREQSNKCIIQTLVMSANVFIFASIKPLISFMKKTSLIHVSHYILIKF